MVKHFRWWNSARIAGEPCSSMEVGCSHLSSRNASTPYPVASPDSISGVSMCEFDIGAENRRGGGTVFHFTLPIEPVPVAEPPNA